MNKYKTHPMYSIQLTINVNRATLDSASLQMLQLSEICLSSVQKCPRSDQDYKLCTTQLPIMHNLRLFNNIKAPVA